MVNTDTSWSLRKTPHSLRVSFETTCSHMYHWNPVVEMFYLQLVHLSKVAFDRARETLSHSYILACLDKAPNSFRCFRGWKSVFCSSIVHRRGMEWVSQFLLPGAYPASVANPVSQQRDLYRGSVQVLNDKSNSPKGHCGTDARENLNGQLACPASKKVMKQQTCRKQDINNNP